MFGELRLVKKECILKIFKIWKLMYLLFWFVLLGDYFEICYNFVKRIYVNFLFEKINLWIKFMKFILELIWIYEIDILKYIYYILFFYCIVSGIY